MRLLWLDLFRGVAAIAVVGYHFRSYLGIPWMDWGYVAVEVFFVLSGLILGLKYSTPITEGMTGWAFAKTRLLRLYPMTFLAGLSILVLNLAGAPANPYVPGDASTPLDTFLVTSFTWSSAHSAAWPSDSPVWSLWAELVCNAIWFFALRAGKRWVNAIGALALVGTLAFDCYSRSIGYGSDAGWHSRIISAAAAVGWFTVGYWLATNRVRAIGSPLALLAALFATVVVHELVPYPVKWIAALAIVGVSTLLINALYQHRGPGPRVGVVAKWLGAASFPIYLIHAPAGRLLPAAGGIGMHWLSLLLVIGGATVVATVLNERIVEWLHRRRGDRGAASVASL